MNHSIPFDDFNPVAYPTQIVEIDGNIVPYNPFVCSDLINVAPVTFESSDMVAAVRTPVKVPTAALYCSICFGDTDVETGHAPCSLGCGHVFVFHCIKRWIKERSFPLCPLCYARINPKQLWIVFAKTRDDDKLNQKLLDAVQWFVACLNSFTGGGYALPL